MDGSTVQSAPYCCLHSAGWGSSVCAGRREEQRKQTAMERVAEKRGEDKRGEDGWMWDEMKQEGVSEGKRVRKEEIRPNLTVNISKNSPRGW